MAVSIVRNEFVQRTTYPDGQPPDVVITNIPNYTNFSTRNGTHGSVTVTSIASAESIEFAMNRLVDELSLEIRNLRTQVMQLESRVYLTSTSARKPLTQVEIEQLVDAVHRQQQAAGQATIWDGIEAQVVKAVEKIHGI